ncbi:S1 family peptidase [Bdellovibrio reynosensis]|uniref:Trypsin-like serine protease n=1 Tax=Bdellovibrio reynosensis TaxID=2835041 RepID=A0ABY4C756_9BACT|nr:trypsin-like serine protease [Bdellovibrio reynosensis]UOF00777.1 trypsin-like serine protease [Bdellovibrio reynosensis]
MLTWSFFSILLCFVLASMNIGCGVQSSELSNFPDAGIIGGSQSTQDQSWSKNVALIYNKSTNTHCTGFLIKKNIILTAAHCLGINEKDMTIAFGIRPMDGNYIRRDVHSAIHHELYKKDGTNRHDVALIRLVNTAPTGYFPIALPPEDLDIVAGNEFIATGYGRISGKSDINPKANYGTGYLRHVQTKIESISLDQSEFYVNQTFAKGICNGDSGGPAIFRYKNNDYAIGIASAISWTTPVEMTEEERKAFMLNKDLCAEKSIYMNIKKYMPWIKEQSEKLSQ